jgi:hypothetical protein
VREPAALAAEPLAGRDEQRAHLLAGEDPRQGGRVPAGRDHARDAELQAPLRGPELGGHAAGADRAAGAARHLLQRRRHPGDPGQRPGVLHLPWIGRVQRVDVAQDHQEVGLGDLHHQRREGVVVAELDLVDRDRVVLVDHRDRAAGEERQERVPRVEEPLPVGEDVVGEQHLADRMPAAQGLLPGAHQERLSDRGRRLLSRQIAGLGLPAEARDAERDRAGRDHDHVAVPGRVRERSRQRGEVRAIEPALRGEDPGTDLHHQPPRTTQLRPFHGARFARPPALRKRP